MSRINIIKDQQKKLHEEYKELVAIEPSEQIVVHNMLLERAATQGNGFIQVVKRYMDAVVRFVVFAVDMNSDRM